MKVIYVSGRQPGPLCLPPGLSRWSWPDVIGPSWHSLAEWNDLVRVDLVADRIGDETRSDRRAVEVQHTRKLRRIDFKFVDQQRAQLAVAVLLDHKDLVVLRNEALQIGRASCRERV